MREIRSNASPTLRLSAWLLVTLVIGIIVGSWFAKTEIVARGQGRVIPVGRIQLIQSQFPGKITEIAVSEGQFVKSGAVLAKLGASETIAEIDRLKAELQNRKREVLTASSILNSILKYDPSTEAFVSDGMENLSLGEVELSMKDPQELALLIEATLSAIHTQIAEVDAEIRRLEQVSATQSVRVQTLKDEMKLVQTRNASIEDLRNKGIINQVQYLDRLRETRRIENEFATEQKETEELVALKDQAMRRREKIVAQSKSQYQNQLFTGETTIASLNASLKAAETRLQNATITASTTGFVDNLKIYTIGRYVEAGQELMSLVPDKTAIEIETIFENRDSGFLEEGQKAIIKLDAFPFERFGVTTGTVTSISSNARQLNNNSSKWVYAALIKPDQIQLKLGNQKFDMVPGMTGTIDVVTGERRLISYFFEPIVKSIQQGFKER